MLADPQRLKWWGIDMRPRWRRRVAVVAAYLSLLAIMVSLPREPWPKHPFWIIAAMCVATWLWQWVSIFRENGVVKSFQEQPYLKIKGMGKMVRVAGLDEWARYRFGVEDFNGASQVQQEELLSKYKYGTYLLPQKAPDGGALPKEWLDERELKERDNAERWALKQIAVALASYTGIFIVRTTDGKHVEASEIVGSLWICWVLVMSLPKARVLWTEPDPGEVNGEMALVEDSRV